MMAFGGATIAQLYRMVELMIPGRIPNIMILVGTSNVSRGSDEEEAQWESMMVCLFATLWQKFKCAVLTVCTVPMSTRTLTSKGRRNNERVIRWINIVRNLASRNAGRMILMDIEHELRAIDQARLTTEGIHFNSIEGQAWMNRVFQERLDELEVELFDTGVLKKEETTNEAAHATFVPPILKTRLASIPVVTQRPQSSREPGQRTVELDRLGEAPVRRTIHPRRRLGPNNSTADTNALRFADLEGLPLNNTMGPVNARPLQGVRMNHSEGNREERPGRFLTTRAPIGQHVKIFKQVQAPPSYVKEKAYPNQVTQEGDVERYGGMKIRKDETIVAAYVKVKMRKAKIFGGR